MMNAQAMNREIDILLVEDNPADIRLTQEAFKETRLRCKLHIARDGAEALEFLRQNGRFAAAPRPDMILLDLNLPKKDGREVLAEVKNEPQLKRIPIVVLTTSNDEHDIRHTYDNHANCFITKPAGLDDFVEVVKKVEEFWLQIARLP
jgi:two-component system, chemotaxis family, response regulator Rcp1